MDDEALFAAALDIPQPGRRRAFLIEACAGEPTRLARIEALLHAHAHPDSFLEPPQVADAPAFGEPIVERPGTSIGTYKLLEQIGEGGFGVVFMAEQTEPVRRKVALKVLKPGMDTRQVIGRFEAERQALALMDHPNIAHIFDGGQTNSGRPYFVMELVRGVPITRFCDDNNLTIADRLALFLSVCNAVQHAHQKGIIHRDIKPSNILVSLHDTVPVVKIIDFGIAKATAQQLSDKTVFTQFAQMIGTPTYMSPEQAALSGLDVDTRSDIYSLGVLLYELLTGTTPFTQEQLRAMGVDEMRRIIREEEPPRPSTRFSTLGQAATTLSAQRRSDPRQLRRQLHGDLDWIVMKALEKDRNRRYETASAFAADVQRYLHDEPVLACPPSRGYRLRKVLRKHRVGVMTAAAFVTLLLAGAAFSGWQAVRATQAKELAQNRLERIEKANDVLAAIVRDINPGNEEKGDPSLQDQLSQRLIEAAGKLDETIGEPLTVARLQTELGNSLRVLTHHREAITLLEKARATREEWLGSDHVDTLSTTHTLAKTYLLVGDLDRAVPLLEQTLTKRSLVLGSDEPDTLYTMGDLAQAYYRAGQQPRGMALMQEALEKTRARLGPDHRATLVAMNNLATTFVETGMPAKAVPLLEQVFDQQKVQLGPDHHHTLNTMNNLALAYLGARQIKEAVTLHEETLEKTRAKLGPTHFLTLTAIGNLAEAYRLAGSMDKALPLYEESFARFKEKMGPDHFRTLATMHNLAGAYGVAGQKEKALAMYQEVLAKRQTVLGPDHPNTLITMTSLAVAYSNRGMADRAVPLFDEVLRHRRKKLGPDAPGTLEAMVNLGAGYREIGKPADGIPLIEAAVATTRNMPGGMPANMTWMLSAMAVTYDADGRFASAEPIYREYLARIRKQFGPEHANTAMALGGLCLCLLRQKKYDEAEPVARDCLAIRARKLPDDWQTYSTRSMLGAALLGQKKYADARPLLLEGYEGLQKRAATIPPPGRPRLREALERLVELYEATGEADKADAWRRQLMAHGAASTRDAKPMP
jgi:serine/threonine protein kinase/tetratricopeptide (TPR) repeat protein